MCHAFPGVFFPQRADLCRSVSANPGLRYDGFSVGFNEHGIEFRSAEIQCAAVETALQMGEPNLKCGVLEFLPGECTEPIWAGKRLNVLSS